MNLTFCGAQQSVIDDINLEYAFSWEMGRKLPIRICGQCIDLEHRFLEVVSCAIHTINIQIYIRKLSI